MGKGIHEIISTRDKLFNYLCSTGIEKAFAFKIVDFVRKGKKMTEEMLTELNAKVPEWYVDSMKKITYLFPSA